MITGELKNKIDSLWDSFAAGGLVNPLDVIEQITYLMFIRDLDDSDNLRAKESAMLGLPYKSIFADEVSIGDRKIDGSQLKWSVFRDFPAGKMYSTMQEWVFPFIKNLDGKKDSAYSKYMDDAIFKLPTPLLLSKVVDALDEIYVLMSKADDKDVKGDTYEYLLNKITQSGLIGQFRTPRHIIKMMVEMMQPTPDDVICDPACGTSGFLVTAGEYLKDKHKEEIFFNKLKKDHYMNHMFFGYDMDRTMLRIGAMNMMTHGVDSPFIEYRDSLSDQNSDKDKYSLILANPPFKGSLDYDTVSADLLKVCKTKKTELLFLALFLRMLKIGGRCACIVPDGVLFGSSGAHQAIRKEIIENNRLEAIISMPSGVFKPYAGVSTAVMIFTKTGHGGTDKVWFYDMKADGLSLDDKRSPIAENDIPDIVARFHNLAEEENRERTEQSFFVPKDEIIANGYDFRFVTYNKSIREIIEYPLATEVMTQIKTSEEDINNRLHDLERWIYQMKETWRDDFTQGYPTVCLTDVTEELFAGGDKPTDVSPIKTDVYRYPVFANGYENKGLQCYSKTYRVSKNAVTVSARGTIGYCVVREPYFTPVVRLITLVPNEKVNPTYLKYAIDSMEIKSSGTSQAQLTVPDFKKKTIILPSMELQNEFANLVEQIDKIKFEIKQSLEKLETLKKSLMQEYFGG